MSVKDFFLGGLVAIFMVFAVGTGAAGMALFLQISQERAGQPTTIAYQPASQPEVLSANTQAVKFEAPTPSTSLGTIAKPVNILLLGLDSRKEDKSARCDAVHTFSFKPDEGKIIITSVPRGTITSNGNIIANVCSIYGFDVAIKEIEKITGVHPDYVVKVGFSEALGALRMVNLPPSPTLQFLRDRKDYGLGDNQRSYNQAVFLKDAILRYTEWGAKLPGPVQYLAFKTIDTNLPYDKAQELFQQLLSSKIYQDPDNIEIVIKPKDNLVRKEIHIEDKVATTIGWQADPEFKSYQNDVIGYLGAIIKAANRRAIDLAITKKLWLQVEDPELRNQFHFNLLNFTDDQVLIQDFILEMDQAGEKELAQQAQVLQNNPNGR